jgi:hypothetical protein
MRDRWEGDGGPWSFGRGRRATLFEGASARRAPHVILAPLRRARSLACELPKPHQNRLGANDLAARCAFGGRQRLALDCEPLSLLWTEGDPALPSRRREGLLSTRTSSWRYSILRAIRLLSA